MARLILCSLFTVLQVIALACTYDDAVRLNEFLSQKDRKPLKDTGYLMDTFPRNVGYLNPIQGEMCRSMG